jgi:acetylornithine deacetylase/succinyl-diaminopimelate desuccinylase-like protein
MKNRTASLLLRILAPALLLSASVAAKDHPEAAARALDLSKQAIALRSVRGEGNQTIQVAQLFRDALVAGGWSDGNIEIVPFEDTAYLLATWPGRDPSLGPIVISAHMDVVEARPQDWERDPFTPVVENGYLFGRGASDTKFDAALAVSALIELRRQGFEPERSIVIAYSGDEETTMATSKIIADRLRNADIVLNVDGASGRLSEETGQPVLWTWQGAEKTYVDYQLEVTNPGGHSSQPRPDNAIVLLSQAIMKISGYRFRAQTNDITRASLTAQAGTESDQEIAGALEAFLANPEDEAALSVLRANPSYVGQIGTTCVVTTINGGHAENALPQRATANINCRIFPGHTRAAIREELAQVIGDPQVSIVDVTGDASIESAASPMREDFLKAAGKAVQEAWGDVPIIPYQSVSASDSMWYRALGVPSYGASATMIKESDDYSHGLNERVPLLNLEPGIVYYLSLLRELASR